MAIMLFSPLSSSQRSAAQEIGFLEEDDPSKCRSHATRSFFDVQVGARGPRGFLTAVIDRRNRTENAVINRIVPRRFRSAISEISPETGRQRLFRALLL